MTINSDSDRLISTRKDSQKKQIHPEHSAGFNHDMQLQIDCIEWVLEKIEVNKIPNDRMDGSYSKNDFNTEKRARLNALQWAKRRALKPEEPPEPPRRCIECGSYKTKIRKGRPRHPSAGSVWNRLGDRESAGGLYHCTNCKELHRKRRVRRAQRLLKTKAKVRTLEWANIIRKIGKVDSLTSADLVEISRNLFDLTILCGCDEHNYYDHIKHKCELLLDPHDSQHAPICSCCQTKMLLYYLGRCMDKLANEDRLPEFSENHLSRARIGDRTYGHVKKDSKLIFQIMRHINAWRDESNMQVIIQRWQFDFQSQN